VIYVEDAIIYVEDAYIYVEDAMIYVEDAFIHRKEAHRPSTPRVVSVFEKNCRARSPLTKEVLIDEDAVRMSKMLNLC